MHRIYAYVNEFSEEENGQDQHEALTRYAKAADIKYKAIYEDKFQQASVSLNTIP